MYQVYCQINAKFKLLFNVTWRVGDDDNSSYIKRKVTSPKIKKFDILQKHFSQENITDHRFPLSEY